MESSNQRSARDKAVVVRFNKEVIEEGNLASFRELMSPDFVNRTAPPGMPSGPDGMLFMFNSVLRPAFPDLRVEIHDQIAEEGKVTTRKTIHGTHRGELMGIAPTNQAVSIDVIDIVHIRDGRYIEHWGLNTLPSVLAQLNGV